MSADDCPPENCHGKKIVPANSVLEVDDVLGAENSGAWRSGSGWSYFTFTDGYLRSEGHSFGSSGRLRRVQRHFLAGADLRISSDGFWMVASTNLKNETNAGAQAPAICFDRSVKPFTDKCNEALISSI